MKTKSKLLHYGLSLLTAGAALYGVTSSVQAADKKPNILVIWGDDIGWQNVSAYGMGTMGYTTPNIDRIGIEGIRFTDHYAQPSCTAGRASFITGQYPIRSGMTTVAQPGAMLGLQAASPCLAEVLKAQGYVTGQFGKNHLGDRNEHLPTVHGFDEFFGNLYHLNTQEEAEQRDYQAFGKAFSGSLEAFEKKFGTRGVLHSFATDKDDPTVDPRFGRIGKQTIVDTGPLTQERMKEVDETEIISGATAFMKKAKAQDKPFFVWLNTSRMHLYTRLNDKWRYAAEKYTSEADIGGSGMLQHDHDVGLVLDFLKANGLDENTIVWYSTDNGPEHSSWPHGGTTPFRGEKMSTYEGGVRAAAALAGTPEDKPPEEQRRQVRAAMAELVDSMKSRPDDMASHYNLGNFHMARGQMPEAVAEFETATRLQPEALPPHVNAALAYNALGHNDKAEASLRRALRLDPTNAVANLNLGMLLAELGKMPEAEQAFRAAFKASPQSAQAAYNLGVLLAKDHPGGGARLVPPGRRLGAGQPAIRLHLCVLPPPRGLARPGTAGDSLRVRAPSDARRQREV